MLTDLVTCADALTNYATGATLSYSAGTTSDEQDLFDNDTKTTFVWSGISTTNEYLQIDLL